MLSAGGTLYWLRCLEAFGQFVAPNSPDPLLLSPVVLIPARDSYLRASKEFEGSTVFVEEARKRAEDTPTLEAAPSPRPQPQPAQEPS